jgi:hypothetical protein
LTSLLPVPALNWLNTKMPRMMSITISQGLNERFNGSSRVAQGRGERVPGRSRAHGPAMVAPPHEARL